MKCKKCGSENVNVQVVGVVKRKHHGLSYWLCFGWLVDLMLWIFLTIPKLIKTIFGHKKYKTKIERYAVCQECGHKWKI